MAQDGSDGNDGRSADTPFATITRAAKAVRPGEVVVVGPGKYGGKVLTRVDGRAGARIGFRSAEPLGAKIEASGEYTAWENRGSYVDIVGFDISGSDYIGLLNYGSQVLVQGNEVHDLAAPSCNRPNGGGGIVHADYSGEGNVTVGNIVHDIMAPAGFCPLIHGIYQSNPGGRIQNNIVYNVTYAGIHLWHSGTAATIANNLVWGAQVGILVGGDSVTADQNLVTNNILLHNVTGIQELGDLFGAGNVYEANLLYRNGSDFEMISGIPTGTVQADPQMVDFHLDGSGDYRLLPSSPGVDAGTKLGAPPVDIDDVKRPQLGGYDIGPYELR